MLTHPPRATRHVPLRWGLLALAVLTSAAAVIVLGFVAYLFAQGYSGGNNPQSVAPLAFPLSFLILVVVGIPVTLVCAVSWAGYLAAARKNHRLSR
jgi:ABC-type polysaccharide/polyol phosphate export permease